MHCLLARHFPPADVLFIWVRPPEAEMTSFLRPKQKVEVSFRNSQWILINALIKKHCCFQLKTSTYLSAYCLVEIFMIFCVCLFSRWSSWGALVSLNNPKSALEWSDTLDSPQVWVCGWKVCSLRWSGDLSWVYSCSTQWFPESTAALWGHHSCRMVLKCVTRAINTQWTCKWFLTLTPTAVVVRKNMMRICFCCYTEAALRLTDGTTLIPSCSDPVLLPELCFFVRSGCGISDNPQLKCMNLWKPWEPRRNLTLKNQNPSAVGNIWPFQHPPKMHGSIRYQDERPKCTHPCKGPWGPGRCDHSRWSSISSERSIRGHDRSSPRRRLRSRWPSPEAGRRPASLPAQTAGTHSWSHTPSSSWGKPAVRDGSGERAGCVTQPSQVYLKFHIKTLSNSRQSILYIHT